MKTPQTARYVHGTHATEQERLGLLNRLLNTPMLRELELSGSPRVLEMGAGTGIFARAMAATGARVVAVERSTEQIAEARRLDAEETRPGSVDYRLGDALSPPLTDSEWGTFDVAHARFLLEHLPAPLECVSRMVRAVRPGGRIVLADDDHSLLRLWPEPDGVLELWATYADVYRQVGNDPHVGRSLVKLLADAGATPHRNTLIFFGGCSGDPLFQGVVENLAGVIESARDPILARGAIGADEFEATLDRFRQFGTRADASVWYGLPWAEGVRPG